MHIIKLTYICHGWSLGIAERPLISEPVEAWQYGPVVPSLYHRYKSFRADPIKVVLLDRSEEFDDQQRNMVEVIEDAYRKCTALDLSGLTHQPGTPWDIVQREYGVGAIIPNELIQEHYHKLAYGSEARS